MPRSSAPCPLLCYTYIQPRNNLGKIYYANGFPDQAFPPLLEAYAIDSSAFEVNNNLGAAYALEKNWIKSVEHYEKALSRQPNNTTVMLNLAPAYAGAGNLDAVRDTYLNLIKLEPNNWDAVFELGKVYATLNDSVNAGKYLSDLLKQNPGYAKKTEAEIILGAL